MEAEVFVGLHEPGAEELLPEPVGRHASREGMLLRHEPRREIEPRGRLALRQTERREERRRAAGHLLARLVVGSPQHHEAVSHLRQIVEDEAARNQVVDAVTDFLQGVVIGGCSNECFRRVRPHLRQPIAFQPRDVFRISGLLLSELNDRPQFRRNVGQSIIGL